MKIAMLGLGTVGKSVFELLHDQNKSEIKLTKVLVRNPEKYQKYQQVNITTNFAEILNDPEIEAVVEVMGGRHPAFEYIKDLLSHHKNVVTANKAVIAAHFKELTTLAAQQQVQLRFEASVGGGIPIIKTLENNYQMDTITEIQGILNGTCNYILSAMAQGNSFLKALKQAQEKGYAEADAHSDISGLDSANKLAILANLAWHHDFSSREVKYTGISSLSSQQVNSQTKLLAQAIKTDEKIELSVRPVQVQNDSIWSTVKNEENGIMIKSQALGRLFLKGPGAGGFPTATSICNDLLAILK